MGGVVKLKSLKASLSAAIALAGMVFAGASAAETIMSVTQMSYDAVGRLECAALRMNPATYSGTLPDACTLATAGTEGPDRITKNVYDAAGQVTQVLQAVGTTDQRAYSTFSYSPNGKIVDSIDAKGNRTYLTYDGFDRLKEMFYPSKTLAESYNPSTQATALASASPHSGNDSDTAATDYEAYLYDANGNLTWHRRRDNRALDYQYDKLNRQIVRSASDASLRSVHTTYDATGKILKKSFDSATGLDKVSYAYDGFGRVYSTTDMNNRTVAYLYNGAGARTLLAHPDNTTLTYTNDYANRLTSITHSSGAVMFSQGYNSLGQRRKLLRGALISTAENTEACASGVNVTCYVYDNIGRLWGMSNDLAGQANDVTWSFAYNRASQIVTLTSDTALYDYRETQSSTQDPTFNGLNQDTGILSTDNSGYDTNGNLTKDGSRVMVYDLENRLLSVAHAGTPTTPFLTLTYDPEGRLSKYTLNGVATDYLYDGTNLIGEYVGGTRQRTYVHGTGVDEPIVWAQGADWSSRQYFIQNYQGSVIRIADINGNGTADIYKYGPYGEPRNASNIASWSGSRFRYTGQTTLPDAQLYYYKARVYDPNMGRFLQTDPIGSKDDLNLYAYTGGDPINGTDPTGLEDEELYSLNSGYSSLTANPRDLTEQGASQELIQWSANRQNIIKGSAAALELQGKAWLKAAEAYFAIESGAGLVKHGKPVLQGGWILVGRQAYKAEVSGIGRAVAKMRNSGMDAEKIARSAHQMRRDVQNKYRSLTPKEKLDEIYARNLQKYGDRDGPSIEYLRERGNSWERIADKASTTGGRDLGL